MKSVMTNEIQIHKVFANMVDELFELLPEIDDKIIKLRIRAIIHNRVSEMNQIIFPSNSSDINKS